MVRETEFSKQLGITFAHVGVRQYEKHLKVFVGMKDKQETAPLCEPGGVLRLLLVKVLFLWPLLSPSLFSLLLLVLATLTLAL